MAAMDRGRGGDLGVDGNGQRTAMSDEAPIADRVRALLARVLDVPLASIGPGFSTTTVPSWDSLNHLMLISEVESSFGVLFSNQEIVDLTSLDRIVTAIGRHLAPGR
jgi:acyl carrier protein